MEKSGVKEKNNGTNRKKKTKISNSSTSTNTPTTVWLSLKRSLNCKPEPSSSSSPSDVHDPISSLTHVGAMATRRKEARRSSSWSPSGCSRSISNLRDVVINVGSKRHVIVAAAENQPPPPPGSTSSGNCNNSPRSVRSSEFLVVNPIVREVIFSNSTSSELKITGCGRDYGACGGGSTFEGASTQGPKGQYPSVKNTLSTTTTTRKSEGTVISFRKEGLLSSSSGILPISVSGGQGGWVHSKRRNSSSLLEADANGLSSNDAATTTCHECGDKSFVNREALEAHRHTDHAVTELPEGDSSRKIVEIICRASWLTKSHPDQTSSQCGGSSGRIIERVLKVHNTHTTISRFEDYRESVKLKASKLPATKKNKHPRCLADGNELLRFHCTTLACTLGLNGSSTLCVSEKCCVCQIIRHGFSARMGAAGGGGIGVFTASTSARAFESADKVSDLTRTTMKMRKALVVCRVIAGRVHRPVKNVQQEMMVGLNGFDSVAGKVSVYSNIEELYLFNPRALLPCFVVICKP